jgi:hypothetical protein
VIGRPLTVETAGAGASQVAVYRGRVVYGGMFSRHVMDKAALYFT